MNTVPSAEQMLVAEGLLRSERQAGGMVVVWPCRRGCGWEPSTAPMRDELVAVQQAVARMLAQLPEDLPALSYLVDDKLRPRPLLQFVEEQTAVYAGRD